MVLNVIAARPTVSRALRRIETLSFNYSLALGNEFYDLYEIGYSVENIANFAEHSPEDVELCMALYEGVFKDGKNTVSAI